MLRLAANNLRRATAQTKLHTTLQQTNVTRSMITSAQKRALHKEQIGAETKTAKPPTKAATPPPPPGASGGGGGGALPILAGLAAAVGGGAYYMDLIPKDLIPSSSKDAVADAGKDAKQVDVKVEAEKKEEEIFEPASASASASVPVVKQDVPRTKSPETPVKTETSREGNRVEEIQAFSTKGRKSEPTAGVEHPSDGNRVSVGAFSAQTNEGANTTTTMDEVNVAVNIAAAAVQAASDAVEAEKELSIPALGKSKIDQELAKAHAMMKATVDETYLKDLESLSAGQLRVRVVQLSSEMNERTKWEAVRLREFLGMKEKEVGEKYMEKMQKQRLEFEDLLARRLREQEGSLIKAASDALGEKERAIESVVNAAASAQQAGYEAALKGNTEQLQTTLSAHYEADFGTKLAEEKASMIADMEKAVATIDDLSKRLQQAEQNLTISRNFESSSQRAHRVSAAALALAQKMETSLGAAEELAALKAAAAESGVIASALEKIPVSVKGGIPTLSELQTGFDGVYTVGREAAYVPAGRSGIGAQLAGKAFASISAPPSPDAAAPEDEYEAKTSDYVLNRAKRHVKLGELEESVSELDKLKGQAAFTVRDWKSAAMDRIAVEKALKVIKMECALLNKNMSG